MLKYLIKYDFKWIFKVVLIFISIGLFCAIVGRLLSLIENSVIFSIISAVFNGASLSLLISGLVNCIIRGWVRLVNNQYKDESYLTNTLPIDRRTHLLSKTISTVASMAISFIALLIGLIIMYYNKNTLQTIKDALGLLSETLDSSVVLLIVVVLLVIFLETVFLVFAGFFGIVYGYTYNQKKMIKSLMFGIIAYMTATLITLILMLIASLFNNDLKGLLFGSSTAQLDFSLLKTLLWCAVGIYLIYSSVLYAITNKVLNKGINID